jgi:hypothetical protein
MAELDHSPLRHHQASGLDAISFNRRFASSGLDTFAKCLSHASRCAFNLASFALRWCSTIVIRLALSATTSSIGKWRHARMPPYKSDHK